MTATLYALTGGGGAELWRRPLAALAARSGTVPVVAMALALPFPQAAALLFSVLPWVTALTVFCGFMAIEAGRGPAADRAALPRVFLALNVAAPAAAWLIGQALGANADEAAWMALAAAAPISAVAVANAAAMGVAARPIAAVQMVGTLAAPLTLPLVALCVDQDTTLDPALIATRVVGFVIAPAVLALLLRGPIGRVAAPWLPSRPSWKGLGILALACLALARMNGVAPQIAAAPWEAAWAALLAGVAALSGGALVAALRWSPGRAAGFLTGNCRTVALVYAAMAPELPPEGHLFMAMTILPIYGGPPLVRALVSWRRRAAGAAAA